jgi:hypothetical protein
LELKRKKTKKNSQERWEKNGEGHTHNREKKKERAAG